jgi:hypothetical protein
MDPITEMKRISPFAAFEKSTAADRGWFEMEAGRPDFEPSKVASPGMNP